MNNGSRYQSFDDPLRALTVATMENAVEEFNQLAAARHEAITTKGTDWSKYSKRWGILRRLIRWLFDPQFEWMTDILDLDDDAVREALMRKLQPPLKVCPKCNESGTIHGDFGFRKVGDRLVPQSWCRSCR